MRNANRNTVNSAIGKHIAKARISERDRQRALHALRHAEAIVEAAFWVKERVASLGGLFLKPGFKHLNPLRHEN